MYSDNSILLKSLKVEDFNYWLKLIDIYYKGYYTISEGKYLFNAIQLCMNKYRLTTNTHLLKDKMHISDIENLLKKLYLLESPYEIKNGVRYYRNTNKLVSEATNIIVINNINKSNVYISISDCAKNLNISRNKIKHCLITGEYYKNYSFVLS